VAAEKVDPVALAGMVRFLTSFVAVASAVEVLVEPVKPVTAADADERVELTHATVALVVEADSPVAKDDRRDVVALAGDAVMLLEVALAFQENGDWEVDALNAEVYGVLSTEVWAGVGISIGVVLGGYAVLPSTLEGIGRVVMLVRNDFDVADVFGNEASDDEVPSCLGSTAACVDTIAKAIELRRRNCILR